MATNNTRRDLSGFFEKDDSLSRVIIPQSGPLQLRNDCQSGRWKIGSNKIGDKLRFVPLGFKKFFGDLGITYSTHWVQLFFVPITGSSEDMPLDLLCVTYLKTTSASNFLNMQSLMQARIGSENWHKSFWTAKFLDKQKGGENPANYYAIDFDVEQIDFENLSDPDYNHICKLLDTQEFFKSNNDSIYNYLSDPQGTANMVEVTKDNGFILGGVDDDAPKLQGHPEMRSAAVTSDGLVDSPF